MAPGVMIASQKRITHYKMSRMFKVKLSACKFKNIGNYLSVFSFGIMHIQVFLVL